MDKPSLWCWWLVKNIMKSSRLFTGALLHIEDSVVVSERGSMKPSAAAGKLYAFFAEGGSFKKYIKKTLTKIGVLPS